MMMIEQQVGGAQDVRLPKRDVATRYSVTTRTIDRWSENDSGLNFPPPTVINKRCYWWLGELINWEKSQAARRAESAAA